MSCLAVELISTSHDAGMFCKIWVLEYPSLVYFSQKLEWIDLSDLAFELTKSIQIKTTINKPVH
jgi:hypothetical protein